MMAKLKEIKFICESAQLYSTHESKIKIVIDVTNGDMGNLINAIGPDEIFNHLPDSDLEAWAKENGFVKEAP
jgi:hypothetical protein